MKSIEEERWWRVAVNHDDKEGQWRVVRKSSEDSCWIDLRVKKRAPLWCHRGGDAPNIRTRRRCGSQGPHMEKKLQSPDAECSDFNTDLSEQTKSRRRRKKSRQRFPFHFAMEKSFFVFLCNNLITSQLPHPKEWSSRWDNSIFVSLFLVKSAPAYENEGENEEHRHVTDRRNYWRACGRGKGHTVASPKYMWTSIKGKMPIYHSLLV